MWFWIFMTAWGFSGLGFSIGFICGLAFADSISEDEKS